MKEFLLFTFDDYYPSGGWNDFAGSFGTESEALAHAAKLNFEHYQVVRTIDLKIVHETRSTQ